VEGVTVVWPQGPIPKEWKIGVKRENGSFDRLHKFDYREAIPTDFSVVWARNVKNGLLRVYGVKGTSEKVKAVDMESSSIRIVE
jgi:hypothetical protein